jgi:hypothetical protein
MDSQPARQSLVRSRGAVLIAAAVSFWPLNVLAVNLSEIVRPERLFALILVFWVIGLVIVNLLFRLGMGMEPAENTGFVAMVVVMSGGPIVRQLGTGGYLVLFAVCVLAGWLSVRLRGELVLAALIWGAVVAVISGPVISFLGSWQELAGTNAVDTSESFVVELSTRPDVFVVVLDGYPGFLAAAQDELGPGEVDLRVELLERGFEVPLSSWSAYPTTMLSIPSFLEMDYPVVDPDWVSAASLVGIHRILSGSNAVTSILKDNGYTTHMIESGWSIGACGSNIDRCTPSPLLDEATYLTLRHTLASIMLRGSPGPYTSGALAGFHEMLDMAPELSRSGTPDFVYMHVVSPHAPFFLRSDCSVEVTGERSGGQFNIRGVQEDLRETYLVGQMDCLDRLMIRLAEAVGQEGVLIFVSDHGTARRGQLDEGSANWSRAAIVERLNNLVAVRLPEGCSIGDEVVLPNVFRSVLDCLSTTTVEPLEERMWGNSMNELSPAVVQELLARREKPARGGD